LLDIVESLYVDALSDDDNDDDNEDDDDDVRT
jgi:hypothetical protein